jgi:hypothetical protein
MNIIKKFSNYRINEAEEIDISAAEKSDELSLDRFQELKEEIERLIEKSVGSESKKLMADFIEEYNRSPEDTVIEGMINDSDIYDFYLMWRNDIDDVLSAINFFDEVPSEEKVYSLYDYIIVGTKRAVREVISLMEG